MNSGKAVRNSAAVMSAMNAYLVALGLRGARLRVEAARGFLARGFRVLAGVTRFFTGSGSGSGGFEEGSGSGTGSGSGSASAFAFASASFRCASRFGSLRFFPLRLFSFLFWILPDLQLQRSNSRISARLDPFEPFFVGNYSSVPRNDDSSTNVDGAIRNVLNDHDVSFLNQIRSR